MHRARLLQRPPSVVAQLNFASGAFSVSCGNTSFSAPQTQFTYRLISRQEACRGHKLHIAAGSLEASAVPPTHTQACDCSLHAVCRSIWFIAERIAMASLQQAIDAIDNLVKLLQSGQLLGGKEASAAPSKQAAAPGPAVAPSPADQPKAAPPPAAKAEQQPQAERQPKAEKQPKTEKQPKAAKAVAAPSSSGPSVGEELLSKAQLAVARVVSVADHPSGSEKLLLCRIDWGGGERQVVAGLKQHIAKEDLLVRWAAELLWPLLPPLPLLLLLVRCGLLLLLLLPLPWQRC